MSTNTTQPSAAPFFRIDDRLIHGQVTVGWRQHLHLDAICIIDNDLATDPFLSDTLQLSAPQGITVQVCTVENAAATLDKLAAQRILVLLKTPQTALQLYQSGVLFETLNVGNIAAGPARKRVHKSIFLGPAEIIALDKLTQHGVHIFFQQTPEEKQTAWKDIKHKI